MRDKHEIRTEPGVKENCFAHCFEFASEVIIAVPSTFIAILPVIQ